MRTKLTIMRALWFCTALVATTPALGASMDQEIDYLIDAVGRDGCRFVRNDHNMGNRAARAHLRSKRENNPGTFSSTEEFITRIASHSETTGKPYLVICARNYQLPAQRWFSMLLSKYRESNR